MTLIDGKQVSQAVKERVAEEVASLKAQTGRVPGLAVVQVGEDPASSVYVKNKNKTCEKMGFQNFSLHLPESINEVELLDHVGKLNRNQDVHGILIQLPLPKQIDSQKVLEAINPEKDVDGFHPRNVGKLVIGLDAPQPCTPAGVIEMLKYYDIETSGKEAVVVGRSNIVGKPMANLMLQRRDGGNAIVTIAHSAAPDLGALTRRADILVVAIGRPGFVTADMVKEGAVVVDVGINRVDDPEAKRGYRVVGDVDYENVAPKCQAITPVPGGVGLMTIALLMQNTIRSAQGEFSEGRER